MNQIGDLPPESDFGWDFNYSAWEANTEVTICKVPWNSSYRDIVRFSNRAALNTYINTAGGETLTIDDAVYLKQGQPIYLDIPFGVANEFNYIRVYNPLQPIVGDKASYFYYFITSVDYETPNTTRFNVQLDVWQTYGYEITFGQTFLERGHLGIAAENAFDDHGRAFLNIPEGLDIGNEYTIAEQYRHSIATSRGVSGFTFDILVMTTVSLGNYDPGTIDNPVLRTSQGDIPENLPSGCEMYWVDGTHFPAFMTDLSDKPWISQGIISITAVPNDIEGRYGALLTDITTPNDMFPSLTNGALKAWHLGSLENPTVTLKTDWRESFLAARIPAKYQILKKLLTFPYCAVEMTTYTGQPLVIKPEAWANPDMQVIENPHLIPGHGRIVFYPDGYNRRESDGSSAVVDGMGTVNDNGEFLDFATSITNLPTFSLVNNSYLSFMASNKNTIAFNHQSADWSQNRALTGIQNSYDQATRNLDLMSQLNNIGIGTAYANTNLANDTLMMRGLQGGANDLIGGVSSGTPKGLLQGGLGFLNAAVSTGIGLNQNNQSLNIATKNMMDTAGANINAGAFMRDTNRNYAEFAARGDNQNAIAGINARVQDAKLNQPTVSGQVGGESFNLARYQWGVDLKIKTLQGSALNAVGNFWLRYGYQMNLWITPPADMKCMTKFTYWKLRETYITASKCPEFFKETIRGIFEKGVTVWSNPADIGAIALEDNAILEGITL